MNADSAARRSQTRRRPDLSVNTSRARSLDHDSRAPLSPPRRQAPVPSPRNTSRAANTKSSAAPRPPPPVSMASSSMEAASGRGPRGQTAADVETFLEMYTPVAPSANKENHPPIADAPPMPGQRDSHDLSLPSRNVRDSLVSNMLLSLDQFSMGQLASTSAVAPSRSAPSFEDHRLYSLSTTTTDDIARVPNIPAGPRNGGGRYGYAYSSDYEGTDDASRVSGSISHGRRSNSSSGFQSSLGRINSMRESMHRSSQPSTPRMMHSRGGKGSKSSSTNSIDTGGYAQVLGSQRWAHGFGGRSSSFDLGQRLPGTSASAGPAAPTNGGGHVPHAPVAQQQPQQQQQQQQPWHIEFSNSFFSEGYDDAAPTPTVPGGPRKLTSPPSMPSIPSYQPPPPEPPAPERRRSTRSSRSATVGRQPQAKFNANTAPPIPAYDLDSAPAPNIGYEKSKESVPSATAQQHPQHPLREKPSFFRRVFGSLRDSVTGNEPAVPPVSSPAANPGFASSTSVETNATRGPQHSSGGHGKTHSTPPSRDSHHSSHAPLQKKPSGFFRRRKKSISEAEMPPPLPVASGTPQNQHQHQPPPPPPPPPPQQQQQHVPHPPSSSEPSRPVSPLKMPIARDDRFGTKAAQSPATSLRRAMSPYLKSSPAFPDGTNERHLDEPLQDTSHSSPLRTQDEADLDACPLSRAASNEDVGGRTARGFSPDYEPPPTATIRSVDPEHVGQAEEMASRQQKKSTHLLETPARQPPALPHPARTGSFLSDDSDSEESPRQAISKSLNKKSAGKKADGRGQLAATPSAVDSQRLSPAASYRPSSKETDRSSGGESQGSKLSLPIEGTAASPVSAGVQPPSNSGVHLPIVKVDESVKAKEKPKKESAKDPSAIIDEPEFVIGMPTEDDRNKALNIFQGNEDFIQKDKAAAWMGEEGPVRQRTLQAYMDLYDFRNQSILNALRDVCSRLVLRAETQQVDRILVAFSKQWCACNPNHGFKSLDIVHTVCYSIMLLNTDLHLADIESKMTRSQFIKNTMTSLQQIVADLALLNAEGGGKLHHKSSTLGADGARHGSMDQDRHLAAPPSATLPPRSGSSLGSHDDCGPLVKAPFDGPLRAWEGQMEAVLKMIYSSIRDERLPLFGAEGTGNAQAPAQGGLSVMGMLKRTPSVLSKAPSEGQVSTRGRVAEASARTSSSRWASKSRSRARVPTTAGANGMSSSRTSFEDGNSIWSPTVSSATWSRQSLGRTQASMSMESFGSAFGRGDYQQSIGFANALSQAIIREDALLSSGQSVLSDDQSSNAKDNNALLEDESLELAGPPWVKEGMVVHKHHLDGMDKKAKDRNWSEVFAVVQKGQMSLFSFTPNKSLRAKGRARHNAPLPKGAVVGGGNWQDNAVNVGTFGLKQTLASALPPPGYSRQRPHVWALSLPTGAVHLFQVGTQEICKEFVMTANYWSARLSTHPLVGGISNIEYGWSEAIVNNALVAAIANESNPALPSTAGAGSVASGTHGPYPPSASRPGSATAAGGAAAGGGRASMQSRSSFRSGSFDFGHARSGSSSSGFNAAAANGNLHGPASRHGKLPGDRVHIAEWVPPTQSLRSSSQAEPQQLQTLLAYVQNIEGELQAHNALRSPMLLAFTPRGHNANKAMANWERKSAYLLREIVKYRTYVDCLTEAERRRHDIYQERDIAWRAARGEEAVATDVEDAGAETARDDGGGGSIGGKDADETLRLS